MGEKKEQKWHVYVIVQNPIILFKKKYFVNKYNLNFFHFVSMHMTPSSIL